MPDRTPVSSDPKPVFTLHDLFRMRRGLNWIFEGDIPEAERDVMVNNHFMAALYIVNGELTVTPKDGGGRALTASAGQWLIPKPESRRHQAAPGTRQLVVNFTLRWAHERDVFSDGLGVVFDGKDRPELHSTAVALEASLSRALSPEMRRASTMSAVLSSQRHLTVDLEQFFDWNILMNQWYQAFCVSMRQAGISPTPREVLDPRITEALHAMGQSPLNEPFREADYAKEAGLSVSQFNRLFTAGVGHSPHHHFDRRRLEAARAFLVQGELPLKEIAYELGFGSPAYFSSWFKGREGCAPSDFREGHGRQS